MIVVRNGQILSMHLRSAPFVRQLSSQMKTGGNPKEKWDMYSGVLLERLPILTKPLNEVETKVQVI